jgi:flagellar biosynthesis GTPase FlhF
MLLLSLRLLPFSAAAQPTGAEVDMAELEKGRNDPVVFINYEGPHARIETLNQIWEIGYSLGRTIRDGAVRAGSPSRYFVSHNRSAPEEGRLDADLFGLGVDVGVDHIRNLRLILQGFLEGAYDYSPADAGLIAEYVTLYNAVFRGSGDYFTGRYKGPVIRNLLLDRAGLSIRFDEWPGRTMMLIPLAFGVPGSLSAVDTSSIAGPRVVEELRTREDLGIDQRRGMVDLKEREAEEAEAAAVREREEIREEEVQIAREREAVAEEQEAIAREREELRADESSGGLPPEERAEAEAALAEREAAAEEAEAALDQREAALEEKKEAAAETEAFAERKAEEAQQERSDIALDQQGIIAREESRLPEAGGLFGIRMNGPDAVLGRLVRIDGGNGAELRSSALNSIYPRSLLIRSGRITAIAGEERGGGAIRLVEINPETLEMVRQGDDDMHPQSLIWVNGQDLYAITGVNGGWYLARFNSDLVRQARSAEQVHPNGTLTFQDDLVVTQRANGAAMVLNGGDLTERK